MGCVGCPRGKHRVAGRGGYVAVPPFPGQSQPPVPNVALRDPQPPLQHLDPLWCPGKSCVRPRLLTTRAVCGSPVQHQMPVFVGQESRHGLGWGDAASLRPPVPVGSPLVSVRIRGPSPLSPPLPIPPSRPSSTPRAPRHEPPPHPSYPATVPPRQTPPLSQPPCTRRCPLCRNLPCLRPRSPRPRSPLGCPGPPSAPQPGSYPNDAFALPACFSYPAFGNACRRNFAQKTSVLRHQQHHGNDNVHRPVSIPCARSARPPPTSSKSSKSPGSPSSASSLPVLTISPSPLTPSASRVLTHVWEYGRRIPPTKKIRALLSAKATLPCLRLWTCSFRSTVHPAFSTRQHLFLTSPINPTLKGLGVLIGGGSKWNKSRHQRFSLSGS